MSMKVIKSNLGYLIAGAILFGVAVNVYIEFKTKGGMVPECQSILIQ